MKKIKYTLFFFLLLSISSYSQRKTLQGKITNDQDVVGIHILNMTSRFNAVTDENGHFAIHISPKDSLVVSSVNYYPEKIIISEEIYEKGYVTITLTELINELDEVVLGPNLSGNIETDIKNIKTEKPLNFDDVGIPGFKGKPEEKIVPVVMAFFPTNVNIEAVYKHLSGYYKKLKIKRKWDAENFSVAEIIVHYTPQFFYEAYQIPENRIYDFLLFCIETSALQSEFRKENHANVLEIFQIKSEEYISRIPKTPE